MIADGGCDGIVAPPMRSRTTGLIDEPTRTDEGGATSKVNVNPIIMLFKYVGFRCRLLLASAVQLGVVDRS